jgi:uncharacterized protein (TIGR03437 family)
MTLRLWALALACLVSVTSPAQVITTVAGAPWVFPGNGPAVNSPLGQVNSVLVDAATGNVYASDGSDYGRYGNDLVVKVTPAGALTVVAGNGTCGFSGDGGPAVSASLCSPGALALDSSGNLYIADVINNRIRRVGPDGIINTIAGNGTQASAGDGGPALAASFGSLTGIALDPAGNVYVSDNCRIRKFTPNGNISTIAGTGVQGSSGDGGPALSALLNYPRGMTFDKSGNLYVSETFGGRVRMITPSGTISTFAGGGNSNPNNVKATNAQLSSPDGLAVDGFGNLYIADGGAQLIFAVSFQGIISIVAGNPPPGSFGGNSLAGFSGDGGPATSATLNSPAGVAVDAAGNLYIADTNNARVRKVVASGGNITTIAGNGMYRFSGDNGSARFASLNSPSALALDSAGNFYIADSLNNRIRKIASDGTITTMAGNGFSGYSGDGGPATAATLNGPGGLALDGVKGNLYISDSGNSVIRSVSPAGIITTVVGPGAGLRFPAGLAFDAAGNLYIADQYDHLIRKVTPSGTITTIAGNGTSGFFGDGGMAIAAQLNYPSGVAVDAAGNVYIADSSNARVRKVTPGGIISTFAGNGTTDLSGDNGQAINAGLPAPNQLLFDAAGNLYVSELYYTGIVRRIAPNGIITTLAGGGQLDDGSLATQASLNSPGGMAIDASGNFYFTDGDRIREILSVKPSFALSPASLAFTTPAGVPGIFTQQIAVGSTVIGQLWTVTESTQSGGGWLAISADTVSGSIPGSVGVSVKPGPLAPGVYQGMVTVQVSVANPTTQSVPVTLTVMPSTTAQLQVQPLALNFSIPAGAASPSSQTLSVGNLGSGTLQWTANASGGNWLSISPASGASSAGAAASVQATVSVGGLATGVYSGAVTFTSAATSQTITVPVTLSVLAQAQTILLSQSGLLFTGVQGGTVVPAQTFGVVNTGQGTINWTATASTLTGGNWLSVTPSSGSSVANSLQIPLVEVDVNASGLAAGQYSGQVKTEASGANNSPQVVTVILSVLPAGSNPGVLVRPTGLIFTAQAGSSSPGSQTVQLGTSSAASVGYMGGVITFDGNWLTAVPLTGAISAGNSRTVQVQPALGSLAPGAHKGSLTLLFTDSSPTQVVDMLLVVVSQASSIGAERLGAAAATCVPQVLQAVSRTLSSNFVSAAGWPTSLEAQVIDDCGAARSDAAVVASFSNGDPALALSSLGNGLYTGTWHPVSSSAQAVVTLRAFVPGLTPALVTIQGGVSGNPAAPAVYAGGVVNAASFDKSGVLAPGSIVSVFGTSLASSTAGAAMLPLPLSLGGASLTIGGIPVPLFYASNLQINAQIPFGLTPNTRPQVVLQTQSAIAVPETITLDFARPGIFVTTASQGVVINGDQLVDATHPATAGDVVVIYCTGLGATTPPVATNQTSPAPAAVAAIQPTVSVGGVNAAVQFAGLTPGSVGLYQVNVQIPPGVPAGSAVSLVMTQGGVSSNTVTIAVH